MPGPDPAANVARTLAVERSRLRTATSGATLALLGAAALAPIAIVVAGGGALPAALAGVAGNVGAGYLEDLVRHAAARVRRGTADPEQVQREIHRELLNRLERADGGTAEIHVQLLDVIRDVGELDRTLRVVDRELREVLEAWFQELERGRRQAVDRIEERFDRQDREMRRRDAGVEELLDLARHAAHRAAEPSPEPPATAPLVSGVVVTQAPRTDAGLWRAGRELTVGHSTYVLLDELLTETWSADRTVVRREGRAMRTVPRGTAETRHVWLRQVESTVDAMAAGEEVRRERALVRALGAGGLQVADLATRGPVTTLVSTWPARRDGTLGETLTAWLVDGVGLDGWRRRLLLAGLPPVCDALAALHARGAGHRSLTPASIVLDGGRLRLRDVGAAAREGRVLPPAAYGAPEQRGGSPGDAAAVDAYQLAAVVHHLLTGRPPHPRLPVPLATGAGDRCGDVTSALDACLAQDPRRRPGVATLAAVVRGHVAEHDGGC